MQRFLTPFSSTHDRIPRLRICDLTPRIRLLARLICPAHFANFVAFLRSAP